MDYETIVSHLVDLMQHKLQEVQYQERNAGPIVDQLCAILRDLRCTLRQCETCGWMDESSHFKSDLFPFRCQRCLWQQED